MAEEDGQEIADLAAELDRLRAEAEELIEGLADAVRQMHDVIITESGGVLGERPGALLAACARPYMHFVTTGESLEFLERAAVYFHAIICGHVFADGNKRTGTMFASAILESETRIDRVTNEQILLLEGVALDAAQPGGLTVEEVIARFRTIFPNPAN